jgi:hypothetical protein
MYTQHQASPGFAFAGKGPQLPHCWTGAGAQAGAHAGAGASQTGFGAGHPQVFVAHVLLFVAQVLHFVAHVLQLSQPAAIRPIARTRATTAPSRLTLLNVDRIP